MAKTQKYISLIILLFTFAGYLTATLGNEWLIYDVDHVGLWQTCKSNDCEWMEYTPSFNIAFLDWYSCVRAFMILSCMFTFIAISVQVCNICNEEAFHQSVVQVSMVLTIVCVIIGVTVYACEKHKSYEDNWGFGWAFYLACVAGILTLIAIVFSFICIKEEKRTFQPYEKPVTPQPAGPFSQPSPRPQDIPLFERTAPPPVEVKEEKDVVDLQVQPSYVRAESKMSGRTSKSGTKSSRSKHSTTKDDYTSYTSYSERTGTGVDDDYTESDASSYSYTNTGERSRSSSSGSDHKMSSRSNLSQFV